MDAIMRIRNVAVLALVLAGLMATVAEAQVSIPPDAQYVASSRGRVYYWIGCSAWSRLKEANLRFFPDRRTAEAAGYTPSRSRGCAGPPASGTPPNQCAVQRIIDGDTFVCTSGVHVRLLLIDAPESSQDDLGLRAKLALEELIPSGSQVHLEYDLQVRDRYGRLLAHVRTDSVWVNRSMVRMGYALVSVYPPNVRRVESLRAAADSARTEEAGLWRLNGFRCTPAEHRRGGC